MTHINTNVALGTSPFSASWSVLQDMIAGVVRNLGRAIAPLPRNPELRNLNDHELQDIGLRRLDQHTCLRDRYFQV